MEYGINHGTAIRDIIASINGNRLIEAIKAYRVLNGVGLKEAKDACEAIRTALGIATPLVGTGEYAVFSRYSGNSYGDYERYDASDKADAFDFASNNVNHRERMYVVQVLSRSIEVTTRTMQAA